MKGCVDGEVYQKNHGKHHKQDLKIFGPCSVFLFFESTDDQKDAQYEKKYTEDYLDHSEGNIGWWNGSQFFIVV